MNISHIDLVRKTSLGELRQSPRNHMRAPVIEPLLHGAAGVLVANFLDPEGAALTLAGVACVAAGKAVYDYASRRAAMVPNAVALIAGGVLTLLADAFL